MGDVGGSRNVCVICVLILGGRKKMDQRELLEDAKKNKDRRYLLLKQKIDKSRKAQKVINLIKSLKGE